MDQMPPMGPPLWQPMAISVGFEKALSLFPNRRFPLLRRAVKNQKPAFSTKVEWLANDRRGRRYAEHNWTTIFRNPWGVTNTFRSSRLYRDTSTSRKEREILGAEYVKERLKALEGHLTAIEHSLKYGVRSVDYNAPYGMCTHMGGVLDVLERKRNILRSDKLTLRVLRDLVILTNRQANDADEYREEWLSEVTLEVTR